MTLNAKNVLQVAVIFYRIFRKLTAKFAGWPTPPRDDCDSPFPGTSSVDSVTLANSLAAAVAP
jgi:hypothetical protein